MKVFGEWLARDSYKSYYIFPFQEIREGVWRVLVSTMGSATYDQQGQNVIEKLYRPATASEIQEAYRAVVANHMQYSLIENIFTLYRF